MNAHALQNLCQSTHKHVSCQPVSVHALFRGFRILSAMFDPYPFFFVSVYILSTSNSKLTRVKHRIHETLSMYNTHLTLYIPSPPCYTPPNEHTPAIHTTRAVCRVIGASHASLPVNRSRSPPRPGTRRATHTPSRASHRAAGVGCSIVLNRHQVPRPSV